MTAPRYKLPTTLAEAHLEIINQARQADEAGDKFEEVSVIDLAKAIFSDRILDGPHTACAGIIAQFPGGLWRVK
jgi:hypothetical protein